MTFRNLFDSSTVCPTLYCGCNFSPDSILLFHYMYVFFCRCINSILSKLINIYFCSNSFGNKLIHRETWSWLRRHTSELAEEGAVVKIVFSSFVLWKLCVCSAGDTTEHAILFNQHICLEEIFHFYIRTCNVQWNWYM